MAVTDCQGERLSPSARLAALRAAHEHAFCEGFQLELDRIGALAAPFVSALRMVRITHSAGDLAGFQNAMGELAEAAKAFQTIEGIAGLAERRLAIHRRREPRTR
jgi:hypothetical protein